MGKSRSVLRTIALVLLCALAGFGGGWLATLVNAPDEETHRDYLLANPEVLPEAMAALQSKQIAARLAPVRMVLETPYPGAVLGNPRGTTTLVEFSDYACGFCRASVADVNKLIAANPDLRVVIRELPILSPDSADAARMALAAADQGKFSAFHDAMFDAGPPTAQNIEKAAQGAGLDLDAARAAIASGKFDPELSKNQSLAGQLGLDGTPSWIAGDTVLAGAVGQARLQEAIAPAD